MRGKAGAMTYLLVLLLVLLSSDTSKKSTTIRIKKATKDKITNLDFVKKDTYDDILQKLVEFYEDYVKRN
jgi:hypothetical protein